MHWVRYLVSAFILFLEMFLDRIFLPIQNTFATIQLLNLHKKDYTSNIKDKAHIALASSYSLERPCFLYKSIDDCLYIRIIYKDLHSFKQTNNQRPNQHTITINGQPCRLPLSFEYRSFLLSATRIITLVVWQTFLTYTFFHHTF